MSKPTKAPTPDAWDEFAPLPDPRRGTRADRPASTLGSALYLLLSMATGIVYFTWAVVGLSVSIPLVVVLVGIPLLMVFLMSVRVVGVLEGWLIEGLIGVPMGRDAPGSTLDLADGDRGLFGAFVDRRTWTTLAYMVAMLPLGIAYFTLVVVGLVVPVTLAGGALIDLVGGSEYAQIQLDTIGVQGEAGPGALIGLVGIGVALLLMMTHVIRWVGVLHARFARAMLVRE